MNLLPKKTALMTCCCFKADLSCRRDGASCDPDGVDASVGILMNPDVGFLLPGLDVPRRVEQVQHLLVVQLET